MAEVIIALSIVSSVITCLELGSKVAERLKSHLSRTKSAPQIFGTLLDTLPLLLTTLEQIKDACHEGTLDFESQSRLTNTVEGCRRTITVLEDRLQKFLPAEGDSLAQKTKKAFKSKRAEKAVRDNRRNLEAYKSALILYFTHFTAIPTASQSPQYASEQGRCFEVPAMSVSYFIGREHLIEKINAYLQNEETVNDCRKIVILRGMGGQGKTQLALEYCRRQRASHSVFWVDATSSSTAFRSFENIASKLAPRANFPNPEAARRYVLKALESFKDPLLLVFDTFDQPGEFTTVKDFFPLGAKIIFTSRHNDSKRLGSSVEVGAMSDDEGPELLLHQAGLEKTAVNLEYAKRITQELGGLALAIDQAATYISSRHVPLHTFSEVYKKRRAAILKHTPTQWEYRKARGDDTEESVSVFTTWEMSFGQLEATGRPTDSIIHLLTLAAFINTNDISEGLFSLYSQQANRPDWLDAFMEGGAWRSDMYQDSVVRLYSTALVTTINLMTDDARISFHPLVAEWLKLRIDQVARARYAEEAIHVVRLFVDNGDKKEMPTQDKSETLGHLDKIIKHQHESQGNGNHISHALKQATVSFGSFYRRLGRYHETRALIEQAMRDGYDSPAMRNLLANMYCDHGELKKAEKLYNTVLISLGKPLPEMGEKKLDATRLEFTYWTQDDKLTEDGLAYIGAFERDLHQFEPWFVSVLSAYNGLGVLYMKIGDLSTAEMLFKQALEGREMTVGPDTGFTAEIVNHLGALYTRTGQYDKAEEFLCRALERLEKASGRDYMTTQLAKHNLGILHLQRNRLGEAEKLLSRTTEYFESRLGPIHVITLSAFHNQALLFIKQGRVRDARDLLEKTIKSWKESGESVAKPEANSSYCLAELYEASQDMKGEAERLFREAAELYSRSLGMDHPQTMEAFKRADAARNNANMVKISIS